MLEALDLFAVSQREHETHRIRLHAHFSAFSLFGICEEILFQNKPPATFLQIQTITTYGSTPEPTLGIVLKLSSPI